MSAQWYYTNNGQKTGPITDLQLKQFVSTGEIKPTDSLWKEGMADWRPANSFKGLFQEAASSPPIANETLAPKNIWKNMSKMADTISSVTADSLGQDDEERNKPAIFLHEQYFGGRTRIGSNLKPLQTLGGKVVASIFSWFYLLSVIKGTISSWQFLPFRHTEYAKITLRQSIRWDKIFPIFATWIIIMIATLPISISITFAAGPIGMLAILFGLVITNLIACQMISSMELDNLHRTEIVFEYGFPNKHLLLFGISDAPIDQQMEGVLMLCEAISKAEFSRWDQFTAHSTTPTSMLSKVVSMVPGMGGSK